jgi:Histidinol phosphatase and related hydrolases of the PHP family
MIKANIHTHSFYCGHGHGTIYEYRREAERLGLGILGFSEHLPLPDGRHARTRMANSLMGAYEADVKKEKEESKISILLGYETDYYPEYFGYVEEIRQRVDYLTFGVHYVKTKDGMKSPFSDKLDKADLIQYGRQYEQAVRTGFFSFAAHPDLFQRVRPMGR